ncbi:hypothetical protein CEXT_174001 [Caerostris extrusa]|uniref:Uncharacterized protein n=1 Tax=Caerostris extrusa TaxID=172846 RepID=A0AAV4R6B7_CAEEX|nr:hypothetical protein CEXT_174001 [Caerostris extrusa]
MQKIGNANSVFHVCGSEGRHRSRGDSPLSLSSSYYSTQMSMRRRAPEYNLQHYVHASIACFAWNDFRILKERASIYRSRLFSDTNSVTQSQE